jgi:type II secretory ATPase GspE/PulE/Tfp pilus assembly ATPase PilB-like protein
MLQFDDSFSNSRIKDLRVGEEERLVQAIAPQHGFDYINLQGYTINPEALSLIAKKTATEAEVVGFDIDRKNVSLATRNPNSPQTQAVIQTLQKQRLTVTVYICSSTSLAHAWERYDDITDSTAEKRGVFEINPDDIIRLTKRIKTKEEIPKILTEVSGVGNTRRISETLELIFAGALALGASDVHIEPEETAVRVRYRFDGVLHDIADLDRFIFERMMSRLKLLSGMVINSRSEAQDGRFTFDVGEREIEIRSSIIPGAVGESIVMRLLDPSVAGFSMDKLDLNPHIAAAVTAQLKKPNGLIITTGPTGSGKTTAIYAFLREAHNEGVKIITIENPVEYKLEGIVQTQTGKDYSFASGLRAVLRQDPDIIMVGEIRDREVAETAIHAAQTGHLVFSTLHTNTAVGGFPRMIDLGVDPRIFGSSMNIIMGQRLVRLLCNDCKVVYEPTPRDMQMISYVQSTHPHPKEMPEETTVYKAVGCAVCGGTGYKGRTGIFEAVIMDEAVEEAILRDPREHVIMEAAAPQGIPTMTQDGIRKLLEGLTSLTELERVIELPYHLVDTPASNQLIEPTAKPAEISGDDFSSHIV